MSTLDSMSRMLRLIVSSSSNVNSDQYVQDVADINGFLVPPPSFAWPAFSDFALALGLSSMGFRLRQSILSPEWTQFLGFSLGILCQAWIQLAGAMFLMLDTANMGLTWFRFLCRRGCSGACVQREGITIKRKYVVLTS